MRTKVIVNPAANKGRCAARWPSIRSRLGAALGGLGENDVAFTCASGHGSALARAAIGAGYRRIVSVGGDGTLNEIVNGVIEADRRIAPDLVLAQVSAGTANEVSRVLGHSPIEAACAAAASPRTRAIDIFRVEAEGPAGRVRRYGLVLAIIGAPATISWRAARVPLLKRLGPAAYLLMTAATALTYSPKRLSISVDGEPAAERRVWGLMLCSFEGAGEGLILAPGADPGDGVLDLVELGALGRIETLFKVLPRLRDGSYVTNPKVTRRAARSINIRSRQMVRVDVDGEAIGGLPMQVNMPGIAVQIAHL